MKDKSRKKINGDLGRVFDAVNTAIIAIAVLTKQQKLNHSENRRDIEVLFEKMKKVDSLPCAVHVEKFKAYDKYLEISNTWKVAMVIAFIGISIQAFAFARAWGKSQEAQKSIKEKIESITRGE